MPVLKAVLQISFEIPNVEAVFFASLVYITACKIVIITTMEHSAQKIGKFAILKISELIITLHLFLIVPLYLNMQNCIFLQLKYFLLPSEFVWLHFIRGYKIK